MLGSMDAGYVKEQAQEHLVVDNSSICPANETTVIIKLIGVLWKDAWLGYGFYLFPFFSFFFWDDGFGGLCG